jgi:hypothetical protein
VPAPELDLRLTAELLTALHRAAPSPEAASTNAGNWEVLTSRSYTTETTVGGRSARVTFTPGLAARGIHTGEHLDLRAAVSPRRRVPLNLSYGLVSTDAGDTWTVALSRSDRRWLASAQQMLEMARPHVVELAHDPDNRAGLAPVIDAARHVAAVRALFDLRQTREELARAAKRSLAARTAFDRYGYAEADLLPLVKHLAQLAGPNRGLIG